ncbi:MAG: DUF697 domain-containing protein [Magnetococcales bacterium]|nr:50S ribosome-binding GTPase [Magnetococcales bacterium]NGZ26955.1 DUF697 domain-containing protein [Magnetococcales bacterium]
MNRRLVSLLAAILLVLLLILFLQLSDLLLSVWQKLQMLPPWFVYSYGGVFALILAGSGWLLWRITREPPPPPVRLPPPVLPLKEEEITSRIERNVTLGVDVEVARRELAEMQARRAGGEFHVAIAGDISSGKSTLINALLPDARPESGPVGGITRQVTRYLWHTPAGDRIILSDLPGLNEVGIPLQQEAREEAIRAHVVLFLCEGDLTRPQLHELNLLAQLSKPLLVGINKVDRLSGDELAMVVERVKERVALLTAPMIRVVTLVAGGQKERLRLLPDGQEIREVVAQPPQLVELVKAMQGWIDQDPALLESLRDSAVFSWVAHKLDESLLHHRRQKADEVVGDYSRQAVLAAMAAVAPGLDVLLQGYLGVRMVRELCQVYEVPFQEISASELLKKTDQQALRSLPMLLAIGGNLLKAFPGVGTMAGGALHAVAYGLIFDTLGRAVIKTLENRGDLLTHPAMRYFEEELSENLDARMGRLIKVLLEAGAEKLMTGKGKG